MLNFVNIFLIFALLSNCTGRGKQLKQQEQCNACASGGNKGVIQLMEDSWELLLIGEWIVGFCVPLIPNCLKFERTWKKFGLEMQERSDIILVASMELEYSETMVRRFSLDTLPTILHVKNGVFRRLPVKYKVKELKDLILNKGWMNTKPLPFWKHPNSWIISISILYLQSIDWVYSKRLLGFDYDQCLCFVRCFVMLIIFIGLTIFCGIYTFLREKLKKRGYSRKKTKTQAVTINEE